jgi:transposase
VPTIPSSLLEPVWVEFAAQLPERGEFDPDHPLGCHRRRIPDRVVFEHLVDALVHGSGYERIASPQCSDSTIRRRLRAWSAAGVAEQVHAVALAAYDRIIGLHLADIPADGCITKAPCGGDKTGPSPVDRRKGGPKRSIATDGAGLPLGIVSAGANRHDSPLLGPPSQRPPPRSARTGPTSSPSTSTPATTPPSPEPCSTGSACTARSPAKAYPHQSRSAHDGSANAPTLG